MPGVTEHRFFQLLAPRFVTDSFHAGIIEDSILAKQLSACHASQAD